MNITDILFYYDHFAITGYTQAGNALIDPASRSPAIFVAILGAVLHTNRCAPKGHFSVGLGLGLGLVEPTTCTRLIVLNLTRFHPPTAPSCRRHSFVLCFYPCAAVAYPPPAVAFLTDLKCKAAAEQARGARNSSSSRAASRQRESSKTCDVRHRKK
jgi:hypothetical protein